MLRLLIVLLTLSSAFTMIPEIQAEECLPLKDTVYDPSLPPKPNKPLISLTSEQTAQALLRFQNQAFALTAS